MFGDETRIGSLFIYVCHLGTEASHFMAIT